MKEIALAALLSFVATGAFAASCKGEATDKKLAVGDRVTVVATKGADGSLSSQKVLLAK